MGAPEITPPCCDWWPTIAASLVWFRFSDFPNLHTMPSIGHGLDNIRVNFCPCCGGPRRSVVELAP